MPYSIVTQRCATCTKRVATCCKMHCYLLKNAGDTLKKWTKKKCVRPNNAAIRIVTAIYFCQNGAVSMAGFVIKSKHKIASGAQQAILCDKRQTGILVVEDACCVVTG